VKKTIFRGTLNLALFFIFSFSAGAAEFLEGRVVGVHDGDTVTLLMADHQQLKIRLAQLDAPEIGQAFGQRSKQSLSDMVFNKAIQVEKETIDKYGRTVGTIFVAGIDVNAEMIRRGAAWVYRKYAKDQLLFQLEAQAKKDKRGLWNLPENERIPPWEWRHLKNGHPSNITPSQSGGEFTCAEKRTCRQMASCAEAHFYLDHCGVSSLDGNHDGTPCSRLCR
jgi:endonuclease YncB( thermonuclease family)